MTRGDVLTCSWCREWALLPLDVDKAQQMCMDPAREDAGLPHSWMTAEEVDAVGRCCRGCPDCLGIGVKQQLAAASKALARLDRVLELLGGYDETCEDRCECCDTWRGVVTDALREVDS